MEYYPASIRNAIAHIATLPGIGQKTAERLVMHLLATDAADVQALARSLVGLKEKVRLCRRCFSLSDEPMCAICRNPARQTGVLCVVEQPADMVAIEKAGAFSGGYHILQGVLSPIDGIGPDAIRLRELFSRVAEESIQEVVVATGTSVEGEATAAFIARQLSSSGIRVSRIASGVPMGGDLKFVDQVTLQRAMERRHEL
ncbi:MAG: recombination mediator RecR [Desulfobacteraceae bacterium]|jgi:recombination protein RecR|nr:recombination mediator RecR [Desulfobacteraceae bacterium]